MNYNNKMNKFNDNVKSVNVVSDNFNRKYHVLKQKKNISTLKVKTIFVVAENDINIEDIINTYNNLDDSTRYYYIKEISNNGINYNIFKDEYIYRDVKLITLKSREAAEEYIKINNLKNCFINDEPEYSQKINKCIIL